MYESSLTLSSLGEFLLKKEEKKRVCLVVFFYMIVLRLCLILSHNSLSS